MTPAFCFFWFFFLGKSNCSSRIAKLWTLSSFTNNEVPYAYNKYNYFLFPLSLSYIRHCYILWSWEIKDKHPVYKMKGNVIVKAEIKWPQIKLEMSELESALYIKRYSVLKILYCVAQAHCCVTFCIMKMRTFMKPYFPIDGVMLIEAACWLLMFMNILLLLQLIRVQLMLEKT